jgi:lipopolysaccharide biosynthesis glycosyltransferase
MAMMRIALCHVLPDAHRVLSLDADLFAVNDCSDVWELPIDDCYLAASHEWHRTGNGLLYCNFGVVMYNLDMMRDGKADECIEVLNRRRYTWVEQDVGNYLCQGRIFDMPATYNSNWWTDKSETAHPRIVHYAGVPRADWADKPAAMFYRDMSWDEALERHEAVLHG